MSVVPGIAFISQDFRTLEEAISNGIWSVDADDLELYVCEESQSAVFISQGNSECEAMLAHEFEGGTGACITQLKCVFVCEDLDRDASSSFTVGLAFDEDFEEAALLAITLRRLRPCPGDPESNSQPEVPHHVSLVLNGQTAVEDIGALPVRIDMDVTLSWESNPREAHMRYKLGPGTASAMHVVDGEITTEFYTRDVRFDKATALFFRGTGALCVRLNSVSCWAAAAHTSAGSSDEWTEGAK